MRAPYNIRYVVILPLVGLRISTTLYGTRLN